MLYDQLAMYANQYVSISTSEWSEIDRIVLYVTKSHIVNVYFVEFDRSFWNTFDCDTYDSLYEALMSVIGNDEEIEIANDIRDVGVMDYIDLSNEKWR
jgi:hypothetical protein